MTFSRDTDSLLRQIVEVVQLADANNVDEVLRRLKHLQRALAPENEFALVLSWLGKCRLVHKLGQEQLPLNSIDKYRVPDLFAVFEHDGRLLPVLIEVKTSDGLTVEALNSSTLSLKPHYLRYAELLRLPMLIAWRHTSLWTLFDFHAAELAERNYKIDFLTAMKENLLGELAGDFSYALAPGTKLRMHIRKLTAPDPETGGFEGVIHDAHFLNPRGERVPDIPHLMSLFMFWENEVERTDVEDEVIQDYVVPNTDRAEFASRTLSQIVHSLAALGKTSVNWRQIIHDSGHLAHDSSRLRALVDEGAEHGVITRVFHQRPEHRPFFLRTG
jgi:hypothetical protein